MSPLVTRLKHAARRMQRGIERGEGERPPGLAEEEVVARRHCLQALAARLGFRSWPHVRAVLERTETHDRGTFMYRDSSSIMNIWISTYDEARDLRAQTGGYLLPYRHQFQIVEAPYLARLGVPAGDDWEAIGRDWVEPADAEAWCRLASRRLDVILGPPGEPWS